VANHKSAAKRARQTPKRRDRNRAIRSRVRSAVKGFLEAVEGGDADAARTSFRSAERELRKAASHGVLPKGQVSRKVSRLAKRLQA
jgi:small subunit ribosomal protein S20